ncbi:spore germination protein [Brevibacillus brevis]|uniref:spore germination protein n=1 Tax=Brevibacillus brevis TaxID=1393 RepID=UPI001F43430E|nr:spore germination protein [Brevibacillus brevis]
MPSTIVQAGAKPIEYDGNKPLRDGEGGVLPTFVGTVTITNNVGNINFGDTANNSPKSVTKAFSGSGGNNSGNVVKVINENSQTNTWIGSGAAGMKTVKTKKRSRRASRKGKKKK